MIVSFDEIDKNCKIIDIRDNISFSEYNIKNSLNVPKIKLLSDPSLYINKDEIVYIVCDEGKSSKSTANILNKLGYKCYSIEGGLDSIKKQ